MKFLLLFFFIFTFPQPPAPLPVLEGKWKLVKIETRNTTIIPERNYFLNISGNSIGYNLDVNRCRSEDFTISEDSIIFNPGVLWCTEICCDGNFEPFAKELSYGGSYKLNNGHLTIRNQLRNLFLVKEV